MHRESKDSCIIVSNTTFCETRISEEDEKWLVRCVAHASRLRLRPIMFLESDFNLGRLSRLARPTVKRVSGLGIRRFE